MTYSFTVKADRIAIVDAFAHNGLEGVSIRALPTKNRRPAPKPGKPVLTFDSAEDILHFVVHFGTEVGLGVFSAWFYDLLKRTGSKKTTINGRLVPDSPTQIAALVQQAIDMDSRAQRSKLPSNTKAHFIKLGKGGEWEKPCLADGTLKFGYVETPHDLCLRGDWDAVTNVWRELRSKPGTAKSDTRQIRTFYEADATNVFITFHAGNLYWCQPSGPVECLPDGNRLRHTVDGWHQYSVGGLPLTSDRLSGALLVVQGYQGTICDVKASDYLIRKLNDEPLPQIAQATQAEEALLVAIVGLLRLLRDKDFELLIDLVFSASGWRRSSVVGGPQKTIDFDLSLPTTGERAFVQVKSETSQAEFQNYVIQLEDAKSYDRMFYAWHTGDIGTSVPAKVTPWGPERVARAVLDAGLLSWLKRKVG